MERIRQASVTLTDDLINQVAKQLGIKDKTRIPRVIEFRSSDASDEVKRATKGIGPLCASIQACIIA